MSQYEDSSPQPVSRRNFLRTVAVAAAASCVTGAGVAYYQREAAVQSAQLVAAPTAAPTIPPLPQIDNTTDLRAELEAAWQKLAESEAENVRLRAELDAANRRLETASKENDDSRESIEVMQAEIDGLRTESGALAGLVALYEELEDIDLYAPISSGLASINQAWANLWDDLPSVQDGVALAETVLGEFDGDVDLLSNGRAWLSQQIDRFDGLRQGIESVLEETQERVGPVLEMLWGWFDRVQSWLPFNLGQSSLRIMESISSLVDEMPGATNGMLSEVALPMDRWFAQDPGSSDPIIRNRLFKPIRNEVMPRVVAMMEKTDQVRSHFDQDFVSEISPVISRRRQKELSIMTYRRDNGLVRS